VLFSGTNVFARYCSDNAGVVGPLTTILLQTCCSSWPFWKHSEILTFPDASPHSCSCCEYSHHHAHITATLLSVLPQCYKIQWIFYTGNTRGSQLTKQWCSPKEAVINKQFFPSDIISLALLTRSTAQLPLLQVIGHPDCQVCGEKTLKISRHLAKLCRAGSTHFDSQYVYCTSRLHNASTQITGLAL